MWSRRLERDGAPIAQSGLNPQQVGEIGEATAAKFLMARGASILDRNVRIGRGEIDLVVSLDGEKIAVEVKSALAAASSDPIYHFDDDKQRQVAMLARRLGIFRIDYIGVEIGATGITVRWLPRVC